MWSSFAGTTCRVEVVTSPADAAVTTYVPATVAEHVPPEHDAPAPPVDRDVELVTSAIALPYWSYVVAVKATGVPAATVVDAGVRPRWSAGPGATTVASTQSR